MQGLINSFHRGRTIGLTVPPARSVAQSPARNILIVRPWNAVAAIFHSKTLELRAETGGGQHGMSFDDWGHRFVSSNSDHGEYDRLP